MNRRISALALCVLSAVGGPAFADAARTAFEQRFIGREWVIPFVYQNPFPSLAECEYWGGSMLVIDDKFNDKWHVGILNCGDKQLRLFSQSIHNFRVKVLDAILLPKLRPGESFMSTGSCELNGKTDRDFIVLVRLGKRERVDWKTGVRKAWIPNPATGKFEELPTRNIVCWRPTPP